MRILSLTPRSPIYVGDVIASDKEATREFIPSDTLFSAMAVAWNWQGRLPERLGRCLAAPSTLRLTSAFPRASDVRLYPMPRGLRMRTGEVNLTGKQRKRIKWVSEGVFRRMLAHEDLSRELMPDNFGQAGATWLLKSEADRLRAALQQAGRELRFWNVETNPRVTIDRVSSASNFFETAQLRFAAGCGLWCAVEGETAWAEEALRLLQDSGIGGMRSIGHGAFAFEARDEPAWPAADGGFSVLLSRYAPANLDEMQTALYAPASAFALTTVGGWCNDDGGKAWRRKHVRLVQEGSLVGAGAVGRLIDVRPEGVMSRPVYRSGIAFAVAARREAVNA